MDSTFGASRGFAALALVALLLIGSTCGSEPATGPGDVAGDNAGAPPNGGDNGGDNGSDNGGASGGDQPAPRPAPGKVGTTDDPKLLIGTYTLREDGVVDGDTFKVDGLRKSLRLLCIDTEETPKPGRIKPAMLALMKNDFPKYARRMRGDSRLPVKYATPMGVDATEWAKKLLGAKAKLRLERDSQGTGTDIYGRTLCHAWLIRENQEPLLYSLECIRLGYSPYFDKYGRSKRFHEAFVAAQNEARAAKRGIWDPKGSHYPDYAERLPWWSKRGDALDRVAQLGKRGPLVLGDKKAITTLSAKVGQKVWVIGTLDDHDDDAIKLHEKGATLRLGGRRYIEIELAGKDVVAAVKPDQHFGLLIAVRGMLDRDGSKMRGLDLRFLRIKVTDAAQVTPGDQLPLK